VLAQLLFPIDPLELVADEAWRLREELADVLDEAAAALRKHDAERAQGVLVRLDGIDDRRHYDALALARDVARRAPRRRPLQRRLDLLGTVAHELGAAVADARAVATGTLRILGSGRPPPPEAAEAVEAAAAAIRTTEPGAVRDAAEHARTVALRATEADDSLGTGVLAHAVVAIADHALRTVEAREEHQRRVAEEPASRVQGFPFRERRGDSEREAS